MSIEFDITKVNFKEEGLIPVIVQDYKTRVVLMLGYMNHEALEKTLEENQVVFFSRSKQRLWKKGETSGNFLDLVSVRIDCDQDAILIKANPVGNVCHTGDDTCWGEKNVKPPKAFPFLKELENIIDKRLSVTNTSKKSYIANLAKKGTDKIAQKVGEEAVELVIESGNENDDLFLDEGADLFFHYLILLHDRGYSLRDILLILNDRNRKN